MPDGDENWGLDPKVFSFTKTFLDPIHKDIWVSAIESQLIDTPQFQRLRGIKQLGTADLVFHGASHSRFEHSLGTMAVADRMVTQINSRVKLGKRGIEVGMRPRRLARIAALLHDVGHAPYGHQLEDDFPLLPKHDSPERLKDLLGPGSLICEILGPSLADAVLETLSAKDDEEIGKLEYPFVADIVGNTVCADLLDYTRRDIYYTGLDKLSGWRMLNYLFIPGEGPRANRIVIDAWKGNHLRSDVVSDILDLLDVRFAISERILFHHSKIATGAMLARAISDSGIPPTSIRDMRDEQLLMRLESDGEGSAPRLAKQLLNRDVFKAVWVSQPHPGSASQIRLVERFAEIPQAASLGLSGSLDRRRSAFAAKCEVEDRLCANLDLPPGSVLISCPGDRMLFKKADSWIYVDGLATKLQESPTDPPKGAISELQSRHRSLWRFHVFIDRLHAQSHGTLVTDAVELCLNDPSLVNTLTEWAPSRGHRIVDHFVESVTSPGPAVTATERATLHKAFTVAMSGKGVEGSFQQFFQASLAKSRTPELPGADVGEPPWSLAEPLESWRSRYVWIEHGTLEWALRDPASLKDWRTKFEDGSPEEDFIGQVNLSLLLDSVLEGVPDLAASRDVLEAAIHEDPRSIYEHFGSQPPTVKGRRKAPTAARDEKTRVAEGAFRKALQGRRFLPE